jgi:hypothetical protein
MTITPAAPVTFQPTNPISALFGTPSSGSLTSLDSALVNLSGLGQLLSVTDTFQTSLASLPTVAADNAGGLVAEVQSFVDAFNTLQSSLGNLSGVLGTSADQSLAVQFSQSLAAQVAAPIANGASTLTTLAQIGIQLQPATTTTPAALTIDLPTLQAAFAADQAGTASLVGQAVQAFGNLAARFAGAAGSQSLTVGELATTAVEQTNIGQLDLAELLAIASQSGLNNAGAGLPLLLGTGLAGTGSTLDLAALFALESFNPSTGADLAAQLTALNQYNAIAALIG